MERIKVGTSLKRDLMERAHAYARSHGQQLNELLEQALEEFLDRPPHDPDYIRRTFGSYRVTDAQLHAILEEDEYDA